jgi:hypothetical protein
MSSTRHVVEEAALKAFTTVIRSACAGITKACDGLDALVGANARRRRDVASVATGRSDKELDYAINGNRGAYTWVANDGTILRSRRAVDIRILAKVAGVPLSDRDIECYEQWGKHASKVVTSNGTVFARLFVNGKAA